MNILSANGGHFVQGVGGDELRSRHDPTAYCYTYLQLLRKTRIYPISIDLLRSTPQNVHPASEFPFIAAVGWSLPSVIRLLISPVSPNPQAGLFLAKLTWPVLTERRKSDSLVTIHICVLKVQFRGPEVDKVLSKKNLTCLEYLDRPF